MGINRGISGLSSSFGIPGGLTRVKGRYNSKFTVMLVLFLLLLLGIVQLAVSF